MVNLQKLVEKLMFGFQREYEVERSRECEELHNALADVLTEKKATIQNTLFVLELVKWELLYAKYQEVMGTVQIPEGNVPIKQSEKPSVTK